ncbi:hypothetical protein SAMN03097699_0884 [Flavobacteriaceae bacterium MAR_2010_188]|nr:hypothetical protein SAMN03097699_0884 [Flavobacteriaceae bacterium MAR_2010_188]
MPQNTQFKLAKRPVGFPSEETWDKITVETPELKKGEMLIEQHYVSLDPAMRGWMNAGKSYVEPIEIGAVMRAGAIGKVIKAEADSKYKVGDCLTGMGGIQQYSITNGEGWKKVDCEALPMPKYLSVLGMTGMTAYFGLLEVGQLKEGDTVLVSAAAGAVGSIVGQIAKIKNCRVIGVAGGKKKCDYLINELNFDAAVDYKSDDYEKQLREACKDGIDVYFDNVGGELLDMALTLIKLNARIVICGAISQYNNKEAVVGLKNYLALLVNRARMEGLIVFDFADRYQIAAKDIAEWYKQGKIKSQEDIFDGIDNFYETFKRLFTGEKQGKLILKVKD